MKLEIIGETYTINQEETMEKVKQLWALAVANKKIAIGAVVAVIIIISLIN
jgi:hypothetical protein